MAKQTNAPRDWRLLAERDLSVAEYLAANCSKVFTLLSGGQSGD